MSLGSSLAPGLGLRPEERRVRLHIHYNVLFISMCVCMYIYIYIYIYIERERDAVTLLNNMVYVSLLFVIYFKHILC